MVPTCPQGRVFLSQLKTLADAGGLLKGQEGFPTAVFDRSVNMADAIGA